MAHRLSLGLCLRSLLLGDLVGLLSGVEPRLLGGCRRLRLALGGLPGRVLLPPFPPSTFLDTNRRDIGEYQSERGRAKDGHGALTSSRWL
eukprot:COSAG01_NODE_254_length_20214_cov_25.086254_10_plen_90_part_00